MDFKIQGDFIELYKLLKVMNLCASGGEAKYAISEGHVRVDGKTETRKACKIRRGQKVDFNGEIILTA